MNNKDILKFNSKCALFLGYKNTTPTDKDFNIYKKRNGEVGDLIETMSMKFHSDWNWIMHVINKMISEEHNGLRFRFNTNRCKKYQISESDKPYKIRIISIIKEVNSEPISFKDIKIDSFYEKEGTIEALNQFLIWYEQK